MNETMATVVKRAATERLLDRQPEDDPKSCVFCAKQTKDRLPYQNQDGTKVLARFVVCRICNNLIDVLGLSTPEEMNFVAFRAELFYQHFRKTTVPIAYLDFDAIPRGKRIDYFGFAFARIKAAEAQQRAVIEERRRLRTEAAARAEAEVATAAKQPAPKPPLSASDIDAILNQEIS